MIIDRAHLGPSDLREIESLVAEQTTLEDVVRWGFRGTPRREPRAVVFQDELSQDFVIPYRDGLFLAYGATCLGAITSVAVWDHPPSADELLDVRLLCGWRPTPTRMRDGPRILGHAARTEAARGQKTRDGESARIRAAANRLSRR